MISNNIIAVVLVGIAAVGLLVFLIRRNKKDRKEFIHPEAADPLEEEKKEQNRGRDQL